MHLNMNKHTLHWKILEVTGTVVQVTAFGGLLFPVLAGNCCFLCAVSTHSGHSKALSPHTIPGGLSPWMPHSECYAALLWRAQK